MIRSKALEVNIADYHVDVQIDPRYAVLQEIMSKYYGIMEGFNTFLKELSHPYKNWKFIIQEARAYGLNYFHLFTGHPQGDVGCALMVEIFTDAIDQCKRDDEVVEAVDDLIVYLQKIASDAGSHIDRFLPVIDATLERICGYPDELFGLFVKSYYQLNRIAEALCRCEVPIKEKCRAVVPLVGRYLNHTYDYWLKEQDPGPWFIGKVDVEADLEGLADVFHDISHARIFRLKERLAAVTRRPDADAGAVLKEMSALPGYSQIVAAYRNTPQRLMAHHRDPAGGRHWKLIFLFHMMNTSGLAVIHEEVLREINRTVSWLIRHENYRNIEKLIRKTFSILQDRAEEFPATALNCVLNMGKGVYQTDERYLVNIFIDSVMELDFQGPGIEGVGNDWQIRANAAHIINIRTWLELIGLNPRWSTRLISYLTIHLALFGVFIKDTDLFPRDITRLLNGKIGPVFNLVRQLAKLFPVYFNDIGAEGLLRDISTELDELTVRRDTLIHFLRKQSHVESSNRIISLMQAVLAFWRSGDTSALKPHIPPNILAGIDSQGIYFDGPHTVLNRLEAQGIKVPEGLLRLDGDTLQAAVAAAFEVSDLDRRRVVLAVRLYQLLDQKYNTRFTEMAHYLGQLKAEAFPDLQKLEEALADDDLKRKIGRLLDYLAQVNAIITSERSFEIREDIYKKRHITVDIPSMYGSYHEMKFDGLGLSFRIESLVNVLFENLIDQIDLTLITKATFYQIFGLLQLFQRALKLNGIASVEFSRQLDFLAQSLEARGFTFTQYLDIFKGFAQAVKNIINDFFHNIHDQNLDRILSKAHRRRLLPKFLPAESGEPGDMVKFKHRCSEIFYRDRLAQTLGLQQLDVLLSRVLNTLFNQADKLPKDKLRRLLNYDPKRAITSIVNVNPLAASIIYLGNKGFNLCKLKEYDLPIPPGFIITTEVFRCRQVIETYTPAASNFREQVMLQLKRLENLTGKRFGDPNRALLLSVRSGSSISQPGMMDTFLNVGINEEIAAGIAAKTGNTWFAWDNYRRFLQCYGMGFGMERDDFDALMVARKQRHGISYKRGFSGDQMRELALDYQQSLENAGIQIPLDPYDQLHTTIERVFYSWHSSKARTYRRIMGISDDWGTAVTVQSMIYGNLSDRSGTGVFFTHNPRWSEDHLRLWGDFTIGNQGEDVVAGLVQTLPISLIQQEIEMRDTDVTLETHFPEIFGALQEWAHDLIDQRGWSPQEIEFTFEGPSVGDLFVLQTRDMSMRERKTVLAFDPRDLVSARLLGHGIGVSGGAMSGRVVFNLEEVDDWRSREPDTHLILVRGDTVPDDIREIYAADGLLTARGGLTSHAAVVAHRLGKTCVAGCVDMQCFEKQRYFLFHDNRLESGDYISIDGTRGSVYQGLLTIQET